MLHLPAELRPPCTPTGLLRHFKEFRVARSGPLLQVQHMYSDPVDPRKSGTTMAPETYSSSQVPMLCEFASPSPLPVPSPCYKEPRKPPLPLLPSHKSLAIKHSRLHFILQARPTSLQRIRYSEIYHSLLRACGICKPLHSLIYTSHSLNRQV